MGQETSAPARPRIALLGPVLPFRGGIAQHTTDLASALRAEADLTLLSFSRQYPKLLFPGESDRDPALAGHEEPGAEYVVDSIGPLTWRRAVRRIVDSGVETLVIPWWTFFLAPCFRSIARGVRHAGVPVVFMCHNVADHEAAWWKRAAARSVLRLGSGWVTHTRQDAEELAALVPGAKARVTPHPTYDRFPPPKGTLPRRAGLELLFFGFVRPYKGLDILIEAMGLLAGEDVMLTVAGEAWEGMDPTVARVAELEVGDRIEFVTRYLADAEVAEYFARCDVAVYPYRSATGSGALAVAYHYRRPVIVTSVGGLPDVVEDGATGRIVPPEDPAALAAAIRGFAADRGEPMRPAVERLAATMTWESLADTVLEACAEAASGARPVR